MLARAPLTMDIADKVAVVTGSGSTSGTGRSTALAMAARGARAVVVSYTRASTADGARAVAAEVEGAGARALVHQVDLADDAQCRAMVDATVDAFGRLDILVNNAAVTVRVRADDLEGLGPEAWEQVLRVNLVGAFSCIRAARPHMEAAGDGAVVNVASLGGMSAVRSSSVAYSASKAGVINMTQVLARILGPAIRVNCISPGFVESQWMAGGLGEDRFRQVARSTAARTPRGRVARPEDVAHGVVFLVESDVVNGINLVCDGGYHLVVG